MHPLLLRHPPPPRRSQPPPPQRSRPAPPPKQAKRSEGQQSGSVEVPSSLINLPEGAFRVIAEHLSVQDRIVLGRLVLPKGSVGAAVVLEGLLGAADADDVVQDDEQYQGDGLVGEGSDGEGSEGEGVQEQSVGEQGQYQDDSPEGHGADEQPADGLGQYQGDSLSGEGHEQQLAEGQESQGQSLAEQKDEGQPAESHEQYLGDSLQGKGLSSGAEGEGLEGQLAEGHEQHQGDSTSPHEQALDSMAQGDLQNAGDSLQAQLTDGGEAGTGVDGVSSDLQQAGVDVEGDQAGGISSVGDTVVIENDQAQQYEGQSIEKNQHGQGHEQGSDVVHKELGQDATIKFVGSPVQAENQDSDYEQLQDDDV